MKKLVLLAFLAFGIGNFSQAQTNEPVKKAPPADKKVDVAQPTTDKADLKTKPADKSNKQSTGNTQSEKVNPDGTPATNSTQTTEKPSSAETKKSGTRMAINEKGLPAKKHQKPKSEKSDKD